MSTSYLVIGDVVIDIIADLGFNITDIPVGASIDIKAGRITPGGGGNIASALSYLGVRAGLVGKCGRDPFCDYYESDLKSYGTNTHLIRTPDAPTGYVISILSKNGERTMIVNPGANAELSIDDLEEIMDTLISYDALFIHGYSLQRRKQAEAIVHLAEHFVESGKKVYVDPSTTSLIEKDRELVKHIFSISSGIFLNEEEAAKYTKTSYIEDIVERMMIEADLVVIKLGFKGSLVIFNGQVKVYPPYIVKPTDTTGAGDSYDAAFLAMLSKGEPVDKAADFANWFAAKTITLYGPRTFPSFEEIEDKLRDYPK